MRDDCTGKHAYPPRVPPRSLYGSQCSVNPPKAADVCIKSWLPACLPVHHVAKYRCSAFVFNNKSSDASTENHSQLSCRGVLGVVSQSEKVYWKTKATALGGRPVEIHISGETVRPGTLPGGTHAPISSLSLTGGPRSFRLRVSTSYRSRTRRAKVSTSNIPREPCLAQPPRSYTNDGHG
ncbi:uncharacterized protein LY79DRAFT_354004 [Colletotrichum navitas]|uniref:Uncharacterized protein n=1 Tax=Colletotrichum navitas TaxID=681940 RepID=A0AAD8Q982_9PEZI|nr:uncharacterized protein LY79DRAFT_354004 [Colletotrichum navitas]KAK1597701.1 hypothetical protein LY79DRAFT_354004 [Colletotrichum navitas]